MARILIKDKNNVEFSDAEGTEKMSLKSFYKNLNRIVNDYYNEYYLRYFDEDLYIDDVRIICSEEFKKNEANNPDSEFNRKIKELIELSDLKRDAKCHYSSSIEEASSKINYLEKRRHLFDEDALRILIDSREYIIENTTQDSKEHKYQIKKIIKELYKDSFIRLIKGSICPGSLIIFIISSLTFHFVIMLASLFYFLYIILGTGFRLLKIKDYKIKDIINDLQKIKKYKKELKMIKKIKVYKPLRETIKEENEPLELTTIINKIEELRIQIKENNAIDLSERLSIAIEEYLQKEKDYKNGSTNIDIELERVNLLKKVEYIEQQLKQRNNSVIDITYLNQLSNNLSSSNQELSQLHR